MASPSALFDLGQGRRDLAALPADWQQNIREAVSLAAPHKNPTSRRP